MGLTESNTIKSYEHFISSYKKLTGLNHETFGEVTIYEHKKKPNEKIIEKIFVMSEELSFQKSIKTLTLKMEAKWPCYCELKAFCQYSEWGCAGNQFIIRLAVQYFERNVFSMGLIGSQNPENKIQALPEENAWQILESIVQLAGFFKRYNLSMGEMSSDNILLNENGQVKFMDMQLMNLIHDNIKIYAYSLISYNNFRPAHSLQPPIAQSLHVYEQ